MEKRGPKEEDKKKEGRIKRKKKKLKKKKVNMAFVSMYWLDVTVRIPESVVECIFIRNGVRIMCV